ncbi:hypothetical protein ACQKM2_39575 [Streptomyces sp. NPDC004126]|uniref:hypothetical protein n=1 Tax=Streptomyces sp. NPDC004126 TaxID=3390695 RepID=UPI003D007364
MTVTEGLDATPDGETTETTSNKTIFKRTQIKAVIKGATRLRSSIATGAALNQAVTSLIREVSVAAHALTTDEHKRVTPRHADTAIAQDPELKALVDGLTQPGSRGRAKLAFMDQISRSISKYMKVTLRIPTRGDTPMTLSNLAFDLAYSIAETAGEAARKANSTTITPAHIIQAIETRTTGNLRTRTTHAAQTQN